MSELTIIIPAYNCESTIKDTILSIIEQDTTNYEILVVNDGSVDQTNSIVSTMIKKFPQIRLLNKPNGGASSARNYGIINSRSKYICFLDSDDKIEKTFLIKMLKKISEGNDVVFSGYNNIFYDGTKKQIKSHFSNKDVLKNFLKGKIKAQTNCWMFSRSFILSNKIFFDETLIVGEDLLFISEVLFRNPKINFVNEYLVNYYCDVSGSLSNIIGDNITEHNKWIFKLESLIKNDDTFRTEKKILLGYRLGAGTVIKLNNSKISLDEKRDIIKKYQINKYIWYLSNGLRSVKGQYLYLKILFSLIK